MSDNTVMSTNNRIVIPMCSQSVEEDFRYELSELLRKYGAVMSAENHYEGNPLCGEDIRMFVYIPTLRNSEELTVREACHIDLGDHYDGESLKR